VNIKTTFILGLIAASFSSLFGQDDAYKALLKRSSVSIHAAQKNMLVANKTEVGGKLAQAVLLQSYAVKLYQSKKEAESACSSLEARKLAWEIINETSHKNNVYATATEEENKLNTKCGSAEYLLKESKKALQNMSESDKDFVDPKSLNSSNIDIK